MGIDIVYIPDCVELLTKMLLIIHSFTHISCIEPMCKLGFERLEHKDYH